MSGVEHEAMVEGGGRAGDGDCCAVGLSRASVTQKLNRKTEWQRRDCLILRDAWGLSADFVQDLVPYEAKFVESVRDHDRDHEGGVCLIKEKPSPRFGASKPGVCNTSNVGRSGVWRQ